MTRLSIRFARVLALSIILAACGPKMPESADVKQEPAAQSAMEIEHAAQLALLDRYFAAYKAKDVEAILATFDDNIVGVLYPATLFGRGIDAARPGIEGDFAGRPESWADMPQRYRIARDKWASR